MICRNCKHSCIGGTQDDIEMGKMKYYSCAVAKRTEDRARYFTGDHKCEWPERSVSKNEQVPR